MFLDHFEKDPKNFMNDKEFESNTELVKLFKSLESIKFCNIKGLLTGGIVIAN